MVIDRAFEEALIEAIESNVNGDYATSHALPSGFGDCALLEASVTVTSIATIEVAFATSGPTFQLLDAAGNPQDILFNTEWIRRAADAVAARAGPDQVQFWREADQLRVTWPEIDINATPTADVRIAVKVRRLRPEISRSAEESHFFLTS